MRLLQGTRFSRTQDSGELRLPAEQDIPTQSAIVRHWFERSSKSLRSTRKIKAFGCKEPRTDQSSLPGRFDLSSSITAFRFMPGLSTIAAPRLARYLTRMAQATSPIAST
jgi:hypothetical protein